MTQEFKEDMAIDPHALEDEWMAQPALYWKYSQLQTQAQRERDRAKEAMDVMKSKLDLSIREDHTAYGLSKITEGAVLSTILANEDYRVALANYNECNYNYVLMSNAIRALEHKKKALENMVSLWLGSYFAGPKQPKEVKGGKRVISVADVARENTQQKLRDRLTPVIEDQEPSRPKARSRRRKR